MAKGLPAGTPLTVYEEVEYEAQVRYIILHYTVLHYTVLHCAVLYYTPLYYTVH